MERLIVFFSILALLMLTACGDTSSAPTESEDGRSENEEIEETINWKFGHLSAEDHIWHKTAEKFAELVKEKTEGQINIEIYPNEQLGGETEVLNSINAGSVDLTISGETLQNWAPKAALLAVPYAFKNQEHMVAAVEGEIGQEIEEEIIEKADVTPLYYHMRAPRNLTSNEPINSPEDLNGFKMRVPNVPLFMDVWEAAGAQPQVMDFSEVFTALQQGVIDGQENPYDLIYSGSLNEVQKYVNETEHVYSWIYVVIGNNQYESLSEDLKVKVEEAAQEAQSFGQDLFEEELEQYKQSLIDKGMEINSNVDKEAFAEVMSPAIENNLNEEQYELYEKILEIEY